MRRLPVILLSVAVSATVAFPQIPNAGFESWTAGAPDGWATSNAAPVYANVTQSSTAHGGTSAVKGEVISIGGPVPIQPILQSGAEGEGFPISTRPAAISGWYQFSPVGGDRFGVNVALFKGGVEGTTVALAASADSTPHASYHQFSVPFQYFTADIPDTCVIQHQIIGPTTGATWHVGSWFLLDDLAFSGTNDVATEHVGPAAFALSQNYPNPFNPTTTIRFTVAGVVAPSGAILSGVEGPAASGQQSADSRVKLAVYDLLGREVAVLVDGQQRPGEYTTTWDASGMPSGVYLARLQAGTFHETRSMILLR